VVLVDVIFHNGKPAPNVEPCFLVMGIQKIQHPPTYNEFAVPINLQRFGEWELLLPLSLNHNPNFCKNLGHTFKTKRLFCKCVGLRLSSNTMIGQKMSRREDILVWL
jgi:hypothetical protein